MRWGRFLLVASIVIVASMLYVIFSGGQGYRSASPQTADDNQRQSSSQAPSVVLRSLDGSFIGTTDFIGQKAVILNFWTSWCPNCYRNIPTLQNIHTQYTDRLSVLMINMQESEALVRRVAEERDYRLPIVLDEYNQAQQSFNVRTTNYHVLIRKDGTIFKRMNGDIKQQDIEALLQE